MTTEKRKTIPIAEDIHRALKVYSSKTGRTMKDLVEEYITILLKGEKHEISNACESNN
jgi:hypothetical protein